MAIETNTLLIGWNRPIVGREGVAAECFAATNAYFEKQQKSGKITSFEPVFLQLHGGDFNGFWLVKGTNQNLNTMQTDEEFVELLLRVNHCVTGVGVTQGYAGQQVQEVMGRWLKTLPR